MSYFVRKIEMAKWGKYDSEYCYDPPADAITCCLRTSGNTLSLWKVDTYEEIQDAVTAITANAEHLDGIYIVILEEECLVKSGLQIKQSEGKTPYAAFRDKHYDIQELSFSSLGKVSNIILDSLRDGGFKQITKKQNREQLIQAICGNKISQEDVNEKLRAKLQ